MAISAEDQALIDTFVKGEEMKIANQGYTYEPVFAEQDQKVYQDEIVKKADYSKSAFFIFIKKYSYNHKI